MDNLTEEQIANRKKWVEALRSGKYTQARGCLAKTNPETNVEGYCCLGVAALTLGYTPEDDILKLNSRCLPKSSGGLSESEKALLGIHTQAPLIDANDTDKLSFDQIADIIDKDTNGTDITFGPLNFDVTKL